MSEANFAEFQKAAAQLEQLGDRKLVLGMRRDLRALAKPVGDRIVEAIADAMPKRGGLAERVRSQGRVSVLINLRSGVRIQLANRGGMYMGAFESGTIRHPVYGNRKAWVSQQVPGGKGAEAFAKEADGLAAAVADHVTETARGAL
jgi:hypothetical protein